MKYIFFVGLIYLTSCQLVLDIEQPEFDPSLVLNGALRPDSTVVVFVGKNKHALDNTYDLEVSGANVTLFSEGDEIGTFESGESVGAYRLDFIPQPGVPYRLEVARSGYETVFSTVAIPLIDFEAQIPSVEKRINEYDEEEVEVTYEIDDAPGPNYYEVVLYEPQVEYECIETEDTSYIAWGDTIYYRSYYYAANENDEIEVEFSNIELFDDNLFDGRKTSISIIIPYYFPYYWCGEEYHISEGSYRVKYILQIRTLTEEFYEYKRRLQLQWDIGNSPFAEPVQVPGNIENGYGILGAFNFRNLEFEVEYELEDPFN